MAFYLSPGVYTVEQDISTIVPAVSTTIGAIVGTSSKGSLDITLATNRQQFIQEYGNPVPGNYFHYTALAFLEKGNQLYCRRVVNGALYAGMAVVSAGSQSSSSPFSTGQSTTDFYYDSAVGGSLFSILAKDPGTWGNSISCTIKNVYGGSAKEVTQQYTFEIDVFYTDSTRTTSLVETWIVSRQQKLDGYGQQMYLESKINGYSSYIAVADNTAALNTVLPQATVSVVDLAGGTNGATIDASHLIGTDDAQTGWYGFANADNIDVRILLGGGFTSTFGPTDLASMQTAMIAIAESRRDCIALLDIPEQQTDNVIDMMAYRDTTLNANSSYAAIYAPWVTINDAYNDLIVNIPASGYAGAQMAYNDYVAQTWFAPAGFNRGILNVLSATKYLGIPLSQGERDTIYPDGINAIQTFRGQGTVIWGQKTLQVKASALDRVNVRRLMIIIEKALTISLQSFVFEPNDDITRFRITGMITTFMDQLSAAGAFQTEIGDNGFAVICDTTNNTPAVIDENELHVDVFVKPVRAAEFIRLQTIITTTGVSFQELVSQGVLL